MSEGREGNAIGRRIVRLRKAGRLTQGQLALAAGVDRSWLSLVETGAIADPGGQRLDKVARKLGVTSHFLLTGDTSAEPDPSDVQRGAAIERIRALFLQESQARVLHAEQLLRVWLHPHPRERVPGEAEDAADEERGREDDR